MSRLAFHLVLISFLGLGVVTQPSESVGEEPVFSGPQAGEPLPSLPLKGVIGDVKGKAYDAVADAGDDPLLLIFFHERTRPAFGLMKTVTQFATRRADTGLVTHVVFLADDPTELERWAGAVRKHLTPAVRHAVSPDGAEGPGSFGLNRNVTLTVLVGSQGKVTANFALVQPQLQADGPPIMKAIAEVTGGGEVPSIESLMAADRSRGRSDVMGRMAQDAKLTGLVRGVINKRATKEQVEKAAKSVEVYIAENEAARKELGRIVARVIGSGRLSNYGNETAQQVLRRWNREYARLRNEGRSSSRVGREGYGSGHRQGVAR